MAAQVGRKGIVGLFKQGWSEIPEVIGSTGLAIVGLGMSGIGIWRYYRNDGDNRRYKGTYVVYRDTDPRVATLRKD